MPRYHFDLIDEAITVDDGGLILPDDAHAIAAGERLAEKLFESRPELRGRECAIMVRDQNGTNLHRAMIRSPAT